ncbi:hypothetical protein [Pseudomonas serbica]|uniref:hypothetical protein n=1 Tax=Pseudomonas serbica TaxID=2965074 RepID=UPI00237B692E|nr:hypothetical protein [Pseudomonas serbica]
MDYKQLLEHSFNTEKLHGECPSESPLVFLADHIFDFTTYDEGMSKLFASKAVEVCLAITKRTASEYVQDEDNYRWFLLMCNMPFFAKRIEWGTSLRGAWWNPDRSMMMELTSCGFWIGDEQKHKPLRFNTEQWRGFMLAVGEFAASDFV